MRYNRFYQETDYIPPTDHTQRLSQYLADLKYEDIPPEVLERAKFILLQTVGVSLAAKGTEIARKASELGLQANGGLGGSATRWVDGGNLSPANAALVAGTLADALDWEDCSWTGHPSAGIIPVALIVAEETHASGKELLTAIVGAYEVYQRIANAVQPSPEKLKSGWGLTSWQIFGTVATAAKLYRFDARKIDQAIGLAAEASTIPACHHAVTMSDFYHFEHGFRARDGILITKAVERGIHNQRDALDDISASGYIGSITDAPKPELLTQDLGQRYLIMETLLKNWPANMWVQSSVEAVFHIIQQHGVIADEVEEIIVDPGNGDRMWAPSNGFTSITHAQFSTPFVVAALLLDQTPGAHWYTDENLKRSELIQLAQRVKSGSSALEYPGDGFALFRQGKYPMKTVTLRTRDGRQYTERVDLYPGHPGNMFTRGEISDRFRIQAAPILQGNRMETAIQKFLLVENVEDVSALGRFLQEEPQ